MSWGRGSVEVMLDRFVFRRDGANSFPENEIAVRSSTCIGVPFRVCVDLAEPPAISRFYLDWPCGPKPEAGPTCHIVAAHRGCVLLRLTSIVKSKTCPQHLLYPDDYFVYRPTGAIDGPSWWPSGSPLTQLPTWIRPKPHADPMRGEEKEAEKWAERLIQQEHEEETALGVDADQEVVRSSLLVDNVGLVCYTQSEGDHFVVAELQLDRSNHRVSAELCLVRSDGGQWELKRLLVDYLKRRDSTAMQCFCPQAVVPFGNCLSWIDYRRGVILGNVLEHSPKLFYLPFPPAALTGCEDMHRGVCAIGDGSVLKFIDVVVNELPRNTFTICTYTLTTTDARRLQWDKDAVTPMTAEELWGLQALAPIPHEVPMFPLVSMRRPHIVHFLLSECTDYIDTIDMKTRMVLSVRPYIKGQQDLSGEDADLAEARSSLLQPFFPAEFSKSLNRTTR